MKVTRLYLLLVLFLYACSDAKTLWKGTCGGKPCELTLVKEPGAGSAYTFAQLQIGEQPPVSLNNQTTDANGMPYSDSLFNGSTVRFVTPRLPYQNTTNTTPDRRFSMLYLDPNRYTPEVYKEYADFFLQQWKTVRQGLHQQPVELPLIGGVVHAPRTDFVRLFHGQIDGSPHFFMVTPDGTIVLLEGKSPEKATGVPLPTPLAPKIEMPGKVIQIADSLRFGPARLRSFRDDHDKSLEDYFKLVYLK